MRSKFSVVVALMYTIFIAGALLFPRLHESSQNSEGLLMAGIRKLLFVSGPLEVIGNFLLFVPVLLALIHAAPGVRIRYLALICCFGSATVEISQSWIPGRVSSIRDFVSNCVGVLLTILILRINPRFTHWVKGI